MLLALALLCAAPATSQLVSKGSIGGTVYDSTGAVVPDAKVTVSSEFGARDTMTSGDGSFLFLALEPGKYTVKVEKQGFKIAEAKDVTVRLNERASVAISLETGAVTQTVEVTETAVGIDPSTTASGGSVTANIFQNAPVGRNITDIPYLVAGVNDGYGTGRANPSISGATGFENLYIVNGVNIGNTGYGAIGTYSNVFGSLGSGVQFDFVKEVQVKTSGFEAQYGQALGGVVNMITKSGGNQLRGGAYFYLAPDVFEAERKQSNPILFNRGTETIGVSSYDLGGDLGGYLIKDRLFWYGGFNAVWTRNHIQAPSNFRAISLGEVEQKATNLNYSAKVNYNIDPDSKHQLEFSIFGDPSNSPFGANRPAIPAAGGGGALQTDYPDRQQSKLEFGSRNITVRYNGAITNSWLLNGSFSHAFNKFEEKGMPDIFGVQDRTEGTPGAVNAVGDGFPTPGTTRGLNPIGGVGFYENNDSTNKQWAVNGTNVFRAFGGHQVDYGFQIEDIDFSWFHERTGPDWLVPCVDFTGADMVAAGEIIAGHCGQTTFGAQLRLRFSGNAAVHPSGYFLQQTRGAFTGRTGNTTTKYGAIYLQDAWAINRWITLKLGVRWEQQRISGDSSAYTFAGNWNPRVGILVDPWANRKTKIFFNFGRFTEKVPQDLAVRSLSNENQYIGLLYAVVNPASPNPLFNSTINPTAACPATATIADCVNNPANWILDDAHHYFAGPGTVAPPGGLTQFAPGTKAQFQDEYVVGIEHEFRGGVLVSGRFLDRRIRRVLEDVSGLTAGAGNAGIPQTYVLANPSAAADVANNTLCGPTAVNTDPRVEDANLGLGCLDAAGNPDYLATSGLVGADGIADGFVDPVRRYRAVEIGVEKRFSKNWQLMANWRISKLDGNYEGLFRNDNQQTDPNISSLFDFVGSSLLGTQFGIGVLPTDRRHITNVYASYGFDNGLTLGSGWRLQSGYPLDNLAAHPVYLNQGEVPLGGRGSMGRSPVTSTIDLHADYAWKMTERFRVKFVGDVFNLWNARRVNRVNVYSDTGFVSGVVPPLQPNPDFQQPQAVPNAYQRPFNARLAFRLEF
jgi:outer membrane receptor protein involved in Fe transport